MKLLRDGLVVAVALVACSAAPIPTAQQDAPLPKESSQDALRQMFTGLAEENVKLRQENKDLRADNDVLKRKLEEAEKQMRRLHDSRNALVIPPQAAPGQGSAPLPPGWRPFQFNGATYYVVPLAVGERDDRVAGTNAAMEVAPARPASRAR